MSATDLSGEIPSRLCLTGTDLGPQPDTQVRTADGRTPTNEDGGPETGASSIDRDAITTDVTHVKDLAGGRTGSLPVAVLTGTYAEMGQQYGDRMKGMLHSTRDRWKQIFVNSGALSFESVLGAIGRPFYTSAPKTRKDLYAGISATSGLSRDSGAAGSHGLVRGAAHGRVAQGPGIDEG